MSRVSDQAFLVHIVSLGQVGDFGSLKRVGQQSYRYWSSEKD